MNGFVPSTATLTRLPCTELLYLYTCYWLSPTVYVCVCVCVCVCGLYTSALTTSVDEWQNTDTGLCQEFQV